jgi:HD-GYP domain-containing protein (c-di-GMP phosphodiesterase class II)
MSFVPIRVSTLRGEQKINFDAYIKINDKHILYLRKGDSFEGLRLQRLKDKKLKKMFIADQDENLYRTYVDANIDMAFDSGSGKSIENRSAIVQGLQQSNAEAVMENPNDEVAYNQAREHSSKFVQFLTKEDQALGQILALENPDKNISQHGVTVASLATGVAQRLGTFDKKQVENLSFGALIHDLEHFYTPMDLSRPRESLTREERAYYESHPTAGAQRISEAKHIDPQIVKIMSQHEEYIDGSGFPVGLRESQTDPLAVIVSTANALDRLMSFQGLGKKEAVKTLTIKHLGCHPLQQIQILGDLINNLK